MGQDIQLFSEKIKHFQAIKGRGKLLKATFDKKKFEIIDDSYNSSPESFSQTHHYQTLKIHGNFGIFRFASVTFSLATFFQKIHIFRYPLFFSKAMIE